MRHKQKTQKFSRFSSYYNATIKSLARAVIERQRIITTEVRAKVVRGTVDHLITLGKDISSLAARRAAFSILGTHDLVHKLFTHIGPMFQQRNGGYTRIIPYKKRRGDNAMMVVLELTEQKTIAHPSKEKKEKEVKVEKPKVEKAHTKPEASVAKEIKKEKVPTTRPKKGIGLGKIFRKQSEK